MRISDWGSDVCSSDLGPPGDGEPARGDRRQAADHAGELSGRYGRCDASSVRMAGGIGTALRPTGSKQTPIVVAATRPSPSTNTPWRIVQEVVPSLATRVPEIGRASCREGVCQYVWISVVDVPLKNKKKT